MCQNEGFAKFTNVCSLTSPIDNVKLYRIFIDNSCLIYGLIRGIWTQLH